jgi:nucleoside-diphosphate-sugar epimerase
MTGPGEILVTGAAGFIGTALVESLRARQVAVRALVRGAAADAPGVRTVIVPDLPSHSDWRPVVEGVSAVVHLAGVAHRRAGALAYETGNVLATERLAAAAARAGVRRFVFVSSAKASGESSGGRPLSEDDPADPRDDYARSKLEAERRLLAVAAKSRLEAVILRPPLVYGPGAKANFLALLRLVDRGVPLPVAGIENRRSLVYVGNLVAAIEACLGHPGAAGRTFFVADARPVSTPELVRAIAAGLGRPARMFRAPAALLPRSVRGSLELDTARIRSALGWRPAVGFADGIAATCRWFAAARR